MQDVREIRFVYYDDTPTTDLESRYLEAFKKIEKLLEDYLDVTPEIAKIKHDDCEMIVTLDNDLAQDFTMDHALHILKKLEELFRVTRLEIDSEYDDWFDTNPHILFGFYEK